MFERLRPFAEKTQVNATIADHMVVNAAFLIARTRETEFEANVRALDAEMGRRLLSNVSAPSRLTISSMSACDGRTEAGGPRPSGGGERC